MRDWHKLTSYRGACKVPGGKLVAVQLWYAQGRLCRVQLDGDFFIDSVEDPSAVVEYMEKLLVVASAHKAVETVQERYPSAQLVGLTAEAIECAMNKAAEQANREMRPYEELTPHTQERPTSTVVQGSGLRIPYLSAVSRDGEKIEQLCFTWNNYDFDIIGDPQPRSPAMHMALDEILARDVARGARKPTLRFWQWDSNAVIIGLHQSVSNEVDRVRAKAHNFTVVRRMTGGGAMFVEPGNTITYSLYVPADFLDGLSGYEAYKRCDEWVILALQHVGIEARYKPLNDITSAAGKIGGAAQRRYRASHATGGSVLHHVTMAYDIDAAKMVEVLRISREKMSDKPVKSAVKRVDPLRSQTQLSRDELWHALENQAKTIIPHIRESKLDAQTTERAQLLAAEKYSSDEWTNRIP
ncbi:biotin/lipoate A/B protein ligase family protein [Alloscardovia venturai]|uniref:Biotin/lipoate A/B protein ligase family protein n=1 Tax=Alloscardovia venturai TaxID=1769421 RepID=A0ABW2Y8B0_9BIFI